MRLLLGRATEDLGWLLIGGFAFQRSLILQLYFQIKAALIALVHPPRAAQVDVEP